MMKEISMAYTPYNIYHFKGLCKKRVILLRAYGVIPADRNIGKEIFSMLEAPLRILKELPNPQAYSKMALSELWMLLMKVFFKWQLDVDTDSLFFQMKKVSKKEQVNMYFKSFTQVSRSIHLLRNDVGLDNKRILNNLMLVGLIPSRLEENINYAKSLDDSLIRAFRRLPTILEKPISHLKQIHEMMQYINVKPLSYEDYGTCWLIYKYPGSTIVSRIEHIINRTSVTDLRLTPLNIYFVVHFKKFLKALEVYEKNFGEITALPSLIMLKSAGKASESLISKKRSYFQFLEVYLGIKPSVTSKAMVQLQFLHCPHFSNLKLNFLFLTNEGFGIDLLRKNFHLLLFPHDVLIQNYHEDLLETKYGKHYLETNNMDKFLQVLLYKVYQAYIKMGGAIDNV